MNGWADEEPMSETAKPSTTTSTPQTSNLLGMTDAGALARWFACPPCEVSWHGTSGVCWSCGDDSSVLSHAPRVVDGKPHTVTGSIVFAADRDTEDASR